MISLKEFENTLSKIECTHKIQIQFGQILNEQSFDNTIENIDKIIGLIRAREYPHTYLVSNIYHESGYYHHVYTDGQTQTFKKSFKNQKVDLKSFPDLRIIVNQDRLVDYKFDKSEKYHHVIQTQTICFQISEDIKLSLIYSCYYKEDKKYSLKLEFTNNSCENIRKIYELITFIFKFHT